MSVRILSAFPTHFSEHLLIGSGRFLMVSLGSLFSPTWRMLEAALSPYMNFETVTKSGNVLPALAGFYHNMQTHQQAVLHQLIPSLMLCLLLSIGFLTMCDFLGRTLSRWLSRFILRRCQSVPPVAG